MLLDVASVLARKAEGVPEMHITAAADKLLKHLIDAEGSIAGSGNTLMTLARADTQALVSRIETDLGDNFDKHS